MNKLTVDILGDDICIMTLLTIIENGCRDHYLYGQRATVTLVDTVKLNENIIIITKPKLVSTKNE